MEQYASRDLPGDVALTEGSHQLGPEGAFHVLIPLLLLGPGSGLSTGRGEPNCGKAGWLWRIRKSLTWTSVGILSGKSLALLRKEKASFWESALKETTTRCGNWPACEGQGLALGEGLGSGGAGLIQGMGAGR